MGGRPGRDGRRLPYWLSFALVTLLLGALTAGFVLIVLPQRFVLQSGLKASGITFPTRAPLFEPVAGVAVAPAPRAAAPHDDAAPAGEPSRIDATPAGPARPAEPGRAPPERADARGDGDSAPAEGIASDASPGEEAAASAAQEAPPPPGEARAVAADDGETSEETPLARARRAAAAGELDRAAALYEGLLAERPADAALWREWAELLQYRLEDAEGARDALLRSAALEPLEPEEALRLARLHAWTGHEKESLALLDALLGEEPALSEAWVLRGDLHRWRGDRLEAARSYRRALALAPDVEGVAEGLAQVEAETARAVAARDRPGMGPELSYFRDSDGYRRLDLAARWSASHGTGALAARTGFRRLEGLGADALHAVEEGPFGEVELSRWWREGTRRAAVIGGAERMEAFGVEPTFGLTLEAWSPAGHAFEARYRHGAAYPLATTLEAVVEPVRADRLQLAAHRNLGGGWAAVATSELASLRGGEVENWRMGAGGSLFRRVSPGLRLGVETRLLGYSDASPRLGDRRLYWDPRTFWSTAAVLELALPERNGWTAHGALRPGVAVVDERDAAGTETVPQLSAEAGLRYRTDRFDLSGDLFHLRGREGDYDAFGFGLRFSVRP